MITRPRTAAQNLINNNGGYEYNIITQTVTIYSEGDTVSYPYVEPIETSKTTRDSADSRNLETPDRAEEAQPERNEEAEEGKDDSEQSVSPLILDLSGNGLIDLVSKENSIAYFELTGDAMAEHTGWIDAASGDGFLVWDQNADGVINDISELFGNAESQGFNELALLDSHADGVIDANDTDFSSLEIWVDANGNGYTEDGELHSLASYNIALIATQPTCEASKIAL